MYVFDSGPFIDLFRHYSPTIFPNLWNNIDELVVNNQLISVKEVFNEIGKANDELGLWAKENKGIFLKPEEKEFSHIVNIFKINHYQSMIRKEEILRGKPVADPFVIAKAKYLNATVITTEKYKENSSRVPNVCEYFNVDYLNLSEFMEDQKWKF